MGQPNVDYMIISGLGFFGSSFCFGILTLINFLGWSFIGGNVNKGEIPIINTHTYIYTHTQTHLCTFVCNNLYQHFLFSLLKKKKNFLFLIFSLSTNSTYHNLKVLAPSSPYFFGTDCINYTSFTTKDRIRISLLGAYRVWIKDSSLINK